MTLQEDFDGRDIFEALIDDLETSRARRDRTAGQLDGDMTAEALPTAYRGTIFRSALEASWAATLDSLGITWEYEPRKVTLPSGAGYVPDFHLPEIGTWVEVKGTGVPRIEKAIEYGQALACHCPRIRGIQHCRCRWPGGELVLIGHPPRPMHPWGDESYDHLHPYAKLRLAWRHGGFLRWESTRGRRTWLARCPDCRLVTWLDSARCRACRGPLAGARGLLSGDSEVEFIRISGSALSQAEPDSETT